MCTQYFSVAFQGAFFVEREREGEGELNKKIVQLLFSEKLCIYKPNSPVIFGRISRGAHLFVSFPSKVTHTESGMNLPEEKLSSELTAPSKEYWLSSKFVATEHLLAILSISNSFMNLSNFINLQLKNE